VISGGVEIGVGAGVMGVLSAYFERRARSRVHRRRKSTVPATLYWYGKAELRPRSRR